MTSWTGVTVFEGVFKSRKILQNKKIANDVAEPGVSPIHFLYFPGWILPVHSTVI